MYFYFFFFFFQAEDGIRDTSVTGVQTCALPIFSKVRDRLGVYCSYLSGKKEKYDLTGILSYPSDCQRCGSRNSTRSEERRVGKECRYRRWRKKEKKKRKK